MPTRLSNQRSNRCSKSGTPCRPSVFIALLSLGAATSALVASPAQAGGYYYRFAPAAMTRTPAPQPQQRTVMSPQYVYRTPYPIGPRNVTWYGVTNGYQYAPQTGLPYLAGSRRSTRWSSRYDLSTGSTASYSAPGTSDRLYAAGGRNYISRFSGPTVPSRRNVPDRRPTPNEVDLQLAEQENAARLRADAAPIAPKAPANAAPSVTQNAVATKEEPKADKAENASMLQPAGAQQADEPAAPPANPKTPNTTKTTPSAPPPAKAEIAPAAKEMAPAPARVPAPAAPPAPVVPMPEALKEPAANPTPTQEPSQVVPSVEVAPMETPTPVQTHGKIDEIPPAAPVPPAEPVLPVPPVAPVAPVSEAPAVRQAQPDNMDLPDSYYAKMNGMAPSSASSKETAASHTSAESGYQAIDELPAAVMAVSVASEEAEENAPLVNPVSIGGPCEKGACGLSKVDAPPVFAPAGPIEMSVPAPVLVPVSATEPAPPNDLMPVSPIVPVIPVETKGTSEVPPSAVAPLPEVAPSAVGPLPEVAPSAVGTLDDLPPVLELPPIAP